MKKKLGILIALVMAISLCLVPAVPVAAASDVWVDDDAATEWYNDATHFATIQPAIDAVDSGGTVHVAAGNYIGQGAWIEKDLLLVGDGASTTTIDSTGTGYVSTIHVTEGATVNVSGFTIIGDPVSSGSGSGRGIGYYSNASGTIANNTVTGSSHGIFIFGGSFPMITSNTIIGNDGPGISNTGGSPTITNNTITENSDAICNIGGSPTITNNTITGNLGSGITNSGGGNPTITNNIISSHPGVGIWAARDSAPTCTYNDFWDNAPDYAYPADAGEGSISQDPLLDETYHLTAGSPCIDAGTDAGVYTDMDGETRPQMNGFDIGADEYSPNTVVGVVADMGEGIVAIDVAPTSINFGTVQPGQSSDTKAITVKNIGFVPVSVIAELDSTGTVFDYLKLGTKEMSSWSISNLAGGTSTGVNAQLVVPRGYSAHGSESATLIFIATKK